MYIDLKNNIDFFIRNKTKFSRKNYVEKDVEVLKRIEKENFYIKDILNQSFTKIKKENVRILDIGCKNWFYVKGEYDFFKENFDNFLLDGIEIDAYRLYSNLYSRIEVAKFYIKDLENTNYIAGNLLDLNNQYDYITWFLPFVVIEPHQYWGLPNRFFYPNKLLGHAFKLLANGGEMLIINQGQFEANEQERLLKELQIPYKYKGKVMSSYYEYKNERYGFIIKKM